jgi:phosphopentomutase
MGFGRVIWIVLDSVGIGEMPDADEYGDRGSDTLGNIARMVKLDLPNLRRLGLANIRSFEGLPPVDRPEGCYGKCALASPGKDTTTGHWEMAGIHLAKPFPLYPRGFPEELIREFSNRIGRGVLGNYPASGTEIIQHLGEEHIRTGSVIVYTSADSVFQIAAHEETVPVDDLYQICEVARELLRGEHEVGRVIARPFVGAPGGFTRTDRRRDYAVAPPETTLLEALCAAGVPVHGVGKISDIFLGKGMSSSTKTKNNADGMKTILAALEEVERGLIFANLVDFDQLYGHRNDPRGYAAALEEVDRWIPNLEDSLAPTDLVFLCADHGCDPTTASTDHSREYVPILALGPNVRSDVSLGTRESLSDIGQTVAENFQIQIQRGASFFKEIL